MKIVDRLDQKVKDIQKEIKAIMDGLDQGALTYEEYKEKLDELSMQANLLIEVITGEKADGGYVL